MKWNTFEIEPPVDVPLLIYYFNGKLDQGYMVASVSKGDVWLLPRDRVYIMKCWARLPEPPKEKDSAQSFGGMKAEVKEDGLCYFEDRTVVDPKQFRRKNEKAEQE